jgi:glyoxylate carboligase
VTGWSGRADLVHTAHVVHGTALLLCPGAASRGTAAVVRVLGARHVLQGLAGFAGWVPPVLGDAVDGVHAASMVGLALLDRAHRRGAAASAAVALAFTLGARWAAAGR